MSTSRHIPNSNIGRQKALNAMVAKNNSFIAPAVSALTPATIIRLNIDNTNYNNAMSAVTVAEGVCSRAMELVITNRALLHDNVMAFVRSLDSCISLGTMPKAARADYGLNTTNKKFPIINTDVKLLLWAQKIIDGDATRVTAGGIAMTYPTIIAFNLVFNATKTALTALNSANSVLVEKQHAVTALQTETDSIILHGWNEVETHYSDLDASAKRNASRLYGVKYISVGSTAVVSGIVTDSVTGLPLPNVKVRISGGSNKTLTDDLGKFTLNTNLYGDLELLTDLVAYTEGITDFTKGNGEDLVVNVAMIPV